MQVLMKTLYTPKCQKFPKIRQLSNSRAGGAVPRLRGSTRMLWAVTRDISHDDSKGTMNDNTKRILVCAEEEGGRNLERKKDALARKESANFEPGHPTPGPAIFGAKPKSTHGI